MPNPSLFSSERFRPRARVALGASALAVASATSAFGFFFATEGYYGNEATASTSTSPDGGSDPGTTTASSSDASGPPGELSHDAAPLDFIAMSVLEAVARAHDPAQPLAAGDTGAVERQPAACEAGRCIAELLPAPVIEALPGPPQFDLEQPAPVLGGPAPEPVVDGPSEDLLEAHEDVADADVPGAVEEVQTDPPPLLMPVAAVEGDDLGPAETAIALPSAL